MPRSRHLTSRIPHPIVDAIELRRTRGEYGDYRNFNELQIAQNTYLSLFPREHLFTVSLARMPTADQDEVNDFSLRLAKTDILVASLTDVKPMTSGEILKLSRHWTSERLEKLRTV